MLNFSQIELDIIMKKYINFKYYGILKSTIFNISFDNLFKFFCVKKQYKICEKYHTC